MTTIDQSKIDMKLLDGFSAITSDLIPLSAAVRHSRRKSNSIRLEDRDSNPFLDGAASLKLQMIYFERLAHFVRSKISVPSALIRDQLAGAPLDRRDFEDGAEAIESIISTLESLDWGLSPEDDTSIRIPAALALKQLSESKGRRGDSTRVENIAANFEGGAKPLLLRVDELKRICKALCRYMQSYTSIRLDSFLSRCCISLHSDRANSELCQSQFLILSAAFSSGLLRQTRLAPYAGRALSLEQLIDTDHSASSLLLFSPLAALSREGLEATFEPTQTVLKFKLSVAEKRSERLHIPTDRNPA